MSVSLQNKRLSASTSRSVFIITPGMDHSKANVALENTYKMEPDKPFPAAKAKNIIQEVFEAELADKVYDPAESTALAKELANSIKSHIKMQNCARFKIVSFVTIGQLNNTAINVASRGQWNAKYDIHAEYTYRNSSLYAIGVVYGLYQE